MTEPGYYDYAPTIALRRPVACCGHPGSGFREVVYDLAALTGLPLHDMDRRIEHEVGQSQWSYVREHGLDRLHSLQADLLPSVLRQSPRGLVLLGEGAVTHEPSLALLRQQAGLAFFTCSATAGYWQLCRRAENQDGLLAHPHLPDRLQSPADVEPLRACLRDVEQAADVTLDLTDIGVHDAVLQMQQHLQALAAADPETDP